MESAILTSLASSLSLNLVLFLLAYKLQSDKLTDISYALSFLTIDVISLMHARNLGVFSWIVFLMVAVWAVRIGGFLLMRVLKVGKDRRFDGMRESFTRFGKFWLGQAMTAWILMLPVTIAFYRGGRMNPLVYAGLIIWIIGFVTESIADYQKFAFKQDPANKNLWIQSGVWRYSRHPNYFGEIAVWVGIYVACFEALNGPQKIIGLASPLLIALLLLFVSGVPMLEKAADKRWGHLKAYRTYRSNTRLLIPLPKKAQ